MAPLIMPNPFRSAGGGGPGGSGLCAGGEFDYFTDAWWSVGPGAVGVVAWNAANNNWDIGIGSNASNMWNVIQSGPQDNWEVGFRPSAVKITYTMGSGPYFDTWDFTVRDASGNTIGSVTGVSNGVGTHTVNVPLTFNGPTTIHDIGDSNPTTLPALQVDTFAYTGSDTIDAICFVP